jgi:fucose 4-O-acetylase-like acetyltransferase
MPLFFFLSGYLSSLRTNYRQFFVEKSAQFLIPYFIYLLTIFFIVRFTGTSNQGMSRLVMGGGYLTGYLGVFWFVPCLFLTQQFCNLILTKCATFSIVLISIGCLLISYVNDWYFDQMIFPYSVNVVLAAVPVYCFGNLYRKFGAPWNKAFIVITAVVGICLTVYGLPNYYNMKVAFYGIPFVTFLSGLAIIAALLMLTSTLPSSSLLSVFGKASLVIMYLHQGLQIALRDQGYTDPTLRIAVALLIPMLFYLAANQWTVSRALLLGSLSDQKSLLARTKALT